MMNKRPNSQPIDDFIDYLLEEDEFELGIDCGDDDNDYTLPHESAMEP